MKELLEIFDKIKGHILAIAGTLYGVGLICWILYSLQHHLGHIDAFETQYFITGIIPSMILLYFLWLFKYSHTHSARAAKWLTAHRVVFRVIKIFFKLVFVFIFINIIFRLGILERLQNMLPAFPTPVKVIAMFIGLNVLLVFSPALIAINKADNSKNTPVLKKLINIGDSLLALYLLLFRYFAFLFSFVIAVLILLEYFFALYPILPQEIGGVKPKAAILVTDPGIFAKQDCARIFPDSSKLSTGETDTLDVYFYNDNKLVFKTHKEAISFKDKARTFEIGRSSIKSIKWLD